MTEVSEEVKLLEDVEEAMRDVVDPELGINVVDLGLVYGLNVEESETGKVAVIDMTLTSAACPLTDVIEDQSRNALVGAGLPLHLHQDSPRLCYSTVTTSFSPLHFRAKNA